MPATRQAFAVEGQYARELRAIRSSIGLAIAQLTLTLDQDNLAAAIEEFAPTAAALVAAGQLQAQEAAVSFVAGYLEAEGVAAPAPQPIDTTITGTNSAGSPLQSVIGRSLANGVFTMLRSGHTPDEAVRTAAQAVARLAASEVTVAADREVAHQGQGDDRISGWLWVLTGSENCAACLSRGDGRIRSMDEPFPRHPGCDCVRSVRLTDDPRTVEHPTGTQLFRAMSPEQQVRQFHTAGEEKAELVRSGQLSLTDLVTVERHSNWRSIVTEKPLVEVAP